MIVKRLLVKKKFVFAVLIVFLVTLCCFIVLLNCKYEVALQNILEIKFEEEKNRIFFIESSYFETGENVKLNRRQACSIESAALMNPKASICIIFATNSNMGNSAILESLKKYENIFFYRLNLREFAKQTPVEGWMLNEGYLGNKCLKETISDILRLLLLWR